MAETSTVTLSSLSLNAATYAERYTLPTFRLRVASGPDAGKEHVFAKRAIVVGSGPDCDFVLRDPSASRHHLRIVGERSGYRITDLDSKNGTWFGGSRLGEIVAGASATLRLGQTELLYDQLPELHEVALSRESEFGSLQGQSPEMREVFAHLAELAAIEIPVAIEGEPGTGKRAAAAALHGRSRRAELPLVTFDCSTADAEAVLQAVGPQGSLYDVVGPGSLLLLEIDEVPAPIQPVIVKAWTDRGESGPRLLVTLTNSLDQAGLEGRVHKDLLRLVKPGQVRLPALRHRRQDIELLVDTLIAEIRRQSADPRPQVVSFRTLQALMNYPWPGNVRELRRHLERAAQLATSRPEELPVHAPGRLSEPIPRDGLWLHAPHDQPGAITPYAEARNRSLQGFDQAYCEMVMALAHGDLATAAQLAGLPRASLEQLMARAVGPQD